jgi:hypothetical protein
MKRVLLTVIALSIVGSLVYSQEDSLPPIPPRRYRAARIGAMGGFTPAWLSLNVDPINSFLVGAGGAPFKKDGVFLLGGAGSAYIMFLPNLRVGGIGMGGSIKSTSLDGFGVRRDAELNVSFGGVTFEYVIPVIERLDVSVGTMLGGGGVGITLRADAGGNKTWGQEWGNFGSGNYQHGGTIANITRKLDGRFFVWVPSVNAEYALLGWLGVRLGVSYVGMSAPSWQLDGNYDLLGVPSDINGKGFMINAGLFVGTF